MTVPSGLAEQVLNEDLDAHGDQDQAADQLRLGLIAAAEQITDLDTRHGEHERRQARNGNGDLDIDAHHGESHARGQRIDTRSNGQRQHHAEGKRIVPLLLFL